VVPLEDLVKDDPVEKSAEPYAEQKPRPGERSLMT